MSLVPSVTETLLAWGIEPVACTRFCEQPGLRHVGGTKNPDLAAIAALAPDLVVMNDEENRREDHDALVRAGIPVHVIRPRTVAEVAPELGALASVVSADAPAVEVPPPLRPALRVFVPIWKRPWMTVGGTTYGSSILGHVGAVNVFDDEEGFPEVTLGSAAARRPDLVLAPSEPYPFAERHRDLLATVAPVQFVDGRDLFWWGSRTPAAVSRLAGLLS